MLTDAEDVRFYKFYHLKDSRVTEVHAFQPFLSLNTSQQIDSLPKMDNVRSIAINMLKLDSRL